jgi:hypothetical protein
MRILTILIVFALTACGGARVPDWTGGKSDRYPESLYLLGHGVDVVRGRAEDRARAEIAKIFEVRIRLTESSSEFHHLSKAGKLVAEEYGQAVEAELTATTDKILQGVRIAELWKDERSGGFHALAVLDRLQTTRALRGDLDDLDRLLMKRMSQAEAAPSPARAFGSYLQAGKFLEKRRGNAADLRVADPAGWVAESPVSAAELATRLDRAVAAIRLGIDLEGDAQEIVRGAMTRALAGRGLPLTLVAEPNLLIKGTVVLESYRTGDPLFWTVAAGQVVIVDDNGTVLDTVRVSVREGSRVEGRAEMLAREKLGERLAAQLVSFLSK